MLKSLTIRNVALIDFAELEFGSGLNVLSGETGAGKSVILDCIDFVLGAKADKGMIRYGENECLVRAVFSCENESVKEALGELDIEADEEIVVSRKFSVEGKGSLKINGCTVTAAMLRRVTSLLVDVHGQSEHFFLLKESNQLRLLDSIAGEGVTNAKSAVREILSARKEIVSSLKLIGGDEGERSRRLDILRYQIDELERADLKENEEAELTAFRDRCRNAARIVQGLASAREYLIADGGSLDGLNGASHALSLLAKYGEQYSGLGERIENAVSELEDVADSLESCLNELDIDEREMERVENRLDEIKTLKKKYGGSVSAAIEYLENARREFELLSDSGERYEKLTAELNKTEDKLYQACLKLTLARKTAAEGFCKRVTYELKTLNITSARFEVEFGEYTREDAPKATSEGLGGVKFLFSANKGEPVKELGKIISGGEMSRFMLAVKAQLSAVGDLGTYIFDEIDAGIGGKTARVVAEKFFHISRNVQIIAVSHLAQIASFADAQYLIEKGEEAGRARTTIRPLNGEERLQEIARLIGGDTESEHALAHAEELLEQAKTYKNSHV